MEQDPRPEIEAAISLLDDAIHNEPVRRVQRMRAVIAILQSISYQNTDAYARIIAARSQLKAALDSIGVEATP